MEWGINLRFGYRRDSRHIHRNMLMFGSDGTTALVARIILKLSSSSDFRWLWEPASMVYTLILECSLIYRGPLEQLGVTERSDVDDWLRRRSSQQIWVEFAGIQNQRRKRNICTQATIVSFERHIWSKTECWRFKAVRFRSRLKCEVEDGDFDWYSLFYRRRCWVKLNFHFLHLWWKPFIAS